MCVGVSVIDKPLWVIEELNLFELKWKLKISWRDAEEWLTLKTRLKLHPGAASWFRRPGQNCSLSLLFFARSLSFFHTLILALSLFHSLYISRSLFLFLSLYLPASFCFSQSLSLSPHHIVCHFTFFSCSFFLSVSCPPPPLSFLSFYLRVVTVWWRFLHFLQ